MTASGKQGHAEHALPRIAKYVFLKLKGMFPVRRGRNTAFCTAFI